MRFCSTFLIVATLTLLAGCNNLYKSREDNSWNRASKQQERYFQATRNAQMMEGENIIAGFATYLNESLDLKEPAHYFLIELFGESSGFEALLSDGKASITGEVCEFEKCNFAWRDSVFKQNKQSRLFIAVFKDFVLRKNMRLVLKFSSGELEFFYGFATLKSRLESEGI